MNNFLKQRYNKLIDALKDSFSKETAKRVYDMLMKDQLSISACYNWKTMPSTQRPAE